MNETVLSLVKLQGYSAVSRRLTRLLLIFLATLLSVVFSTRFWRTRNCLCIFASTCIN